jgi:hypothetical protein
MDGGELRGREPGDSVALVALQLIGDAQLLQEPEDSLGATVVEVMDDEHGGSSRVVARRRADCGDVAQAPL